MATKEKKVGGVSGDEQNRDGPHEVPSENNPWTNGSLPPPANPAGTQAQQKPKRKPDGEIQLMARIDRMLANVDTQVAQRIVAWLASRMFGGKWTLDNEKCNMPPV